MHGNVWKVPLTRGAQTLGQDFVLTSAVVHDLVSFNGGFAAAGGRRRWQAREFLAPWKLRRELYNMKVHKNEKV
jgi:hypothetical protein